MYRVCGIDMQLLVAQVEIQSNMLGQRHLITGSSDTSLRYYSREENHWMAQAHPPQPGQHKFETALIQ